MKRSDMDDSDRVFFFLISALIAAAILASIFDPNMGCSVSITSKPDPGPTSSTTTTGTTQP